MINRVLLPIGNYCPSKKNQTWKRQAQKLRTKRSTYFKDFCTAKSRPGSGSRTRAIGLEGRHATATPHLEKFVVWRSIWLAETISGIVSIWTIWIDLNRSFGGNRTLLLLLMIQLRYHYATKLHENKTSLAIWEARTVASTTSCAIRCSKKTAHQKKENQYVKDLFARMHCGKHRNRTCISSIHPSVRTIGPISHGRFTLKGQTGSWQKPRNFKDQREWWESNPLSSDRQSDARPLCFIPSPEPAELQAPQICREHLLCSNKICLKSNCTYNPWKLYLCSALM